MAVDYDFAAVHAAICGSDTVGQYTDTIVDRYRKALAALKAAKDANGVQTPLISSSTSGPFDTPATTSADVREQLTAAWECESGVYRTVQQMHDQFLQDLTALNNATASGSTSTTTAPTSGSTGSLPSGTSQGNLTWAADYSKGSVTGAGFMSTNWNAEDGGSWPPPIVTAPDRSSEKCLKFSLPQGGKRIEVQPNAAQNIQKGQDVWYGFWFIVDSSFTRSIDDWHIICQFHGNDTTSPHQIIAINGGNLITNNAPQHYFANGQIKAGVRYNLVTHVSATSGGPQSVWLNGNKVLDNYNAGLNATPLYLKCGIYCRPGSFPAQTVYQGQHRIGTGYGAVAPR